MSNEPIVSKTGESFNWDSRGIPAQDQLLPLITAEHSPFARFCAASLSAADRQRLFAIPQLERKLSTCLNIAETVWPELRVSTEHFLAHLVQKVILSKEPNLALSNLRVSELYLAYGCAIGNEAAIAAFERKFMPDVEATLSQMRIEGSLVDEAKQLLRIKLLLSQDATPSALATYSGQGQLVRWLRVVTTRLALDLTKKEASIRRLSYHVCEEAFMDPELALFKETYRREFKRAFQQALTALNPHDTTIIWFHICEKLTPGQIGQIYQVHRTTVLRWLVQIQEKIYHQTCQYLREKLAIGFDELESILRLVRSQLSIELCSMPHNAPGTALSEKSVRDD